MITALGYYSRIRFIEQLLPLLKAANSLSRVVDIVAGGFEGNVDSSDFPSKNMSVLKLRQHLATMHTLALESL